MRIGLFASIPTPSFDDHPAKTEGVFVLPRKQDKGLIMNYSVAAADRIIQLELRMVEKIQTDYGLSNFFNNT
jgi:hypothetical protein